MIQPHPSSSFDVTLNFWEEFPTYKVHRFFGEFWVLNKKANTLKNSSTFMWGLSLCYDRISAIFTQPEYDKWEVVSEDLFKNKIKFSELNEDIHKYKKDLVFPKMCTLRYVITQFEDSIDTPLGLALRALESKLMERKDFMMKAKYTFDEYKTNEKGKQYLVKGTVDQLDKMFIGTDKIETLIKKALTDLKAIEGSEGAAKGGETESLSDGDSSF